ncbi:MAG: trehalose-phosphatase [Acidobacteriaceae bacterium]
MSRWPKQWTAPADTAGFFAEVETGASLLMLDYDGTLAPFTANRLKAFPYDGVKERLETLLRIRSVRLVLVTGRPARELKDLAALSAAVEIWGSHGREHLLADGSYTLEQVTGRQMQVLQEIAERLSRAGYGEALERKPASLAVHWRTLDAAGQRTLQQLTIESFERSGAQEQLKLLSFESGLEIRCGNVDKGDAISRTLATAGTRTPAAYLGDDLTDEDAFKALRGRGLTILVGEQVRESAAEYWLHPPEQLLAFLDAWIQHAPADAEERRP